MGRGMEEFPPCLRIPPSGKEDVEDSETYAKST